MTTQQELADQIEQSCHVTIEHGLVGGTILTKDKLDTIVTALRAHDDMLDALKEAVRLCENYELIASVRNDSDKLAPGRWLNQARAAIVLAESQS